MVFSELAGFAGRTLKKLKKRGRERKREEERGKERKKEERRGEEERRRQKTKGERRKSLETLMFMNFSRIDHELILEHDCSELMRNLMRQLMGINGETVLAGSAPRKN